MNIGFTPQNSKRLILNSMIDIIEKPAHSGGKFCYDSELVCRMILS